MSSISRSKSTQKPDRGYEQRIEYHSLKGQGLEDILELPVPRFTSVEIARRQLRYVEAYARDLGCETVVLEDRYTDRDYIEDHSVFYSKSLYPYQNHCKRIHFFNLPENDLRNRVRALQQSALSAVDSQSLAPLENDSNQFSEQHYLGFAVIRPLAGCPVGRTVLRCFPKASPDGHLRYFNCVCNCEVHFMGLTLRVAGLAFQQQDLGVSACATTALWTSLQRARQLESAAAATPAQITTLASQYALPFGRAMPSEGLSLGQMCIAVQSLGFSPSLFKADSFESTLYVLHTCVASGVSPVLIIAETPDHRHAVAVAGMALRRDPPFASTTDKIEHESERLLAVYIHDDRYGPYLKATIRKPKAGPLQLSIRLRNTSNGSEEYQDWTLTHILIPTHPKIRVSYNDAKAGLQLTGQVQLIRERIGSGGSCLHWEYRIVRSHRYLEFLLQKTKNPALVEELFSSVCLSRYVGVVGIVASDVDRFDALLDTTGTPRNLNCLALVQHSAGLVNTATIIGELSLYYGCPVIAPS